LPDGFSFSLFVNTATNGSRISLILSLPFGIIHLASLLIFFTPFHWYYLGHLPGPAGGEDVLVTAGYHVIFRTARSRPARFQFVIAFMAMTSSAEGRALVGGASSPPSPAFRPRSWICIFSDAIRLFSGRTSVGLSSDKYNDTR